MKQLSIFIALTFSLLCVSVQAETNSKRVETRIAENVQKCFAADDVKQFDAAIEEKRNYWLEQGDKAKFMTNYQVYEGIKKRDAAHFCPANYPHVMDAGLPKFKRFAENVWGISAEGKTDKQVAEKVKY